MVKAYSSHISALEDCVYIIYSFTSYRLCDPFQVLQRTKDWLYVIV